MPSQETKIVVKLGGFTNGMSICDIEKKAEEIGNFYELIIERIKCFIWDGDPFKQNGSKLDEERGTSGCFTHAIKILRERFPNIPFVAVKREDQLHKLESDYFDITKYGSLEVGCDEDIFGPIVKVGETRNTFSPNLLLNQVNVITVPPKTHWSKLGIENIKFWNYLGYSVHYVMIGGGNIVKKELENISDILDTIWSLATSRLSPKKDGPIESVKFGFSTNDDTLPVELFSFSTPKWCKKIVKYTPSIKNKEIKKKRSKRSGKNKYY
jgi:hypothetical protein|uniref:Uncharacterized protein n=1 Tax=viral metagenome TaxID=1070528 RepID=A0A6C0IZ78_9ZZZZ